MSVSKLVLGRCGLFVYAGMLMFVSDRSRSAGLGFTCMVGMFASHTCVFVYVTRLSGETVDSKIANQC